MSWTAAMGLEGPGTVRSVMAVWTDVAAWPNWDAREKDSYLDGPFGPGVTGGSTQGKRSSKFRVTGVTDAGWTNTTPLPGGALTMHHTVTPVDAAVVRVEKTYTATGPLSMLFRVFFGRGIRAEIPATLAALLDEAARRAAATSTGPAVIP